MFSKIRKSFSVLLNVISIQPWCTLHSKKKMQVKLSFVFATLPPLNNLILQGLPLFYSMKTIKHLQKTENQSIGYTKIPKHFYWKQSETSKCLCTQEPYLDMLHSRNHSVLNNAKNVFGY